MGPALCPCAQQALSPSALRCRKRGVSGEVELGDGALPELCSRKLAMFLLPLGCASVGERHSWLAERALRSGRRASLEGNLICPGTTGLQVNCVVSSRKVRAVPPTAARIHLCTASLPKDGDPAGAGPRSVAGAAEPRRRARPGSAFPKRLSLQVLHVLG